MEAHTIKIDCPMIDFGMMERLIINGKELNIKGLSKWSFIFEVGHEPRMEMEVERPASREGGTIDEMKKEAERLLMINVIKTAEGVLFMKGVNDEAVKIGGSEFDQIIEAARQKTLISISGV